jgi:hypothetical protein
MADAVVPAFNACTHVRRANRGLIKGETRSIEASPHGSLNGSQVIVDDMHGSLGGSRVIVGDMHGSLGGSRVIVGDMRGSLGGSQFIVGDMQGSLDGSQFIIGDMHGSLDGSQFIVGDMHGSLDGSTAPRRRLVHGEEKRYVGRHATLVVRHGRGLFGQRVAFGMWRKREWAG